MLAARGSAHATRFAISGFRWVESAIQNFGPLFVSSQPTTQRTNHHDNVTCIRNSNWLSTSILLVAAVELCGGLHKSHRACSRGRKQISPSRAEFPSSVCASSILKRFRVFSLRAQHCSRGVRMTAPNGLRSRSYSPNGYALFRNGRRSIWIAIMRG